MFNQKPTPVDEDLEKLIQTVYSNIDASAPDTKEFARSVKQLKELYDLKPEKPEFVIDPNTALTVAGNLLGILLIVGYESRNIMTSKAIGFVLKLR